MNEARGAQSSTKKVLITQSNYIPWKGFFDAINLVDTIVLYDTAQYTRRDWRNRNKIKTPNGLLWLSIPVDAKGNYFQKINETKVKDATWNQKHWKTINFNYKRAAFFEEYKAFFEGLYLGCTEEYLSEINFRFLTEICTLLNIKTTFLRSEDFDLSGAKTEKLLDICKGLGATHYYSGPAAKDYLDTQLFINEGISVEWLDYSGYPVYRQLYGEFEHDVSIIDLIFNEGPNAYQFMKSFQKGSTETTH